MSIEVDIPNDGTGFVTLDEQQILYIPAMGPQGMQGPQGIQGLKGDTGDAGADGVDGVDGVGISSTTGNGDGTFTLTYTDGSSFTTADFRGAQGIQGDIGPQGIQGLKGDTGNAGVDGVDGVGISSTTGNGDGTFTLTYTDGSSFTTADFRGAQGPQGIQGDIGPQGIQGLKGDTGDAGADGVDGVDGVGISSTTGNGDGTFTLTYTDGSSFTTADFRGAQGVQGIQGDIGPQGIQGLKGDTGDAGADGVDGVDGVGISSTTDNGDGTFTLTYTDGSSFTTADFRGAQGPQGIFHKGYKV